MRPSERPAKALGMVGNSVIGIAFASYLLTDNFRHLDSEIHISQFTFGSWLRIAWQESRGFSMVVTGIGQKAMRPRLHNVILRA